jgi:class 3 adenylate cyclase
MAIDYLFVSCDIVAHSAEPNLAIQRQRVLEINQIIAGTINRANGKGLVWSSGGDGGHLAFPLESELSLTIELIRRLRCWSNESSHLLRIIACYGPVESIQGADGRVQFVGHGINLAGRLLALGDPLRVMVTEEFYEKVKDVIPIEVRLHNKRTLELRNFSPKEVYLLSSTGLFESTWENSVHKDSLLHQKALERK